jgi:hypothetical protein
MPAIEVFLPLPPSTNHLFDTFVNRKAGTIRRVRSKRYDAWIEEAGRRPLAGEWARLAEQAGNGIMWELHLTVYGLSPLADLSNRIKAVEDLICAMTGLEDRNTLLVKALKAPTPHPNLGPGVLVSVKITRQVTP